MTKELLDTRNPGQWLFASQWAIARVMCPLGIRCNLFLSVAASVIVRQ